MSKTNRDQLRRHQFDDDEGYDSRMDNKRNRKRNKRSVEQNLKNIARNNGYYDEEDEDGVEDDLFNDY